MMLLALTLAFAEPAPAAPACGVATAFVGTICTPGAAGAHPAVIVLGGSGGGDRLRSLAARFAARGYVSASVAYFGLAGLPASLDEIPVETVGTAIDAIAKRPDVDPAHIAVFGDSKGGELALLAASTYPQIHAVVAVVPSPFAWQGAGFGSSWTVRGKPVPWVNLDRPHRVMRPSVGGAVDMRSVYDASMQLYRGAIAGAMFALEKIQGPLLLLAGDDDGVWDSPAQCELAMAYLRTHPHPYADEYVHYARAGHAFLFATAERPQPQGQAGGSTGGTPRGNVDAAEKAWAKIDDFLGRALMKDPSTPSA
jgi:dienelactone hydrolase